MHSLITGAYTAVDSLVFKAESGTPDNLVPSLEEIQQNLIDLDDYTKTLANDIKSLNLTDADARILSGLRRQLESACPRDKWVPSKSSSSPESYEEQTLLRLTKNLSYHKTATRKLREQVKEAGKTPVY